MKRTSLPAALLLSDLHVKADRRLIGQCLRWLDSGADGEELDHVRAPAVRTLPERYVQYAAAAELARLVLEALHRQLTRLVQRLRVVGHLRVAGDVAQRLAQ